MAAALAVSHEDGRDAFLAASEQFLGSVEPLSDHDLLAASHCWGWAVVDVVSHVRLGFDEIATVLLNVGPPAAFPDHDAASYWLTMPPADAAGPGEVQRILATRRLGASEERPRDALAPLRDRAGAVAAAVRLLSSGTVSFQGLTMTTGDFLTTWAVELVVHQLDVGRDQDVPPPVGLPLTLTRRTLETLLEAPLPVSDDVDAVLLGTGRRTATEEERQALGSAATRLPVL